MRKIEQQMNTAIQNNRTGSLLTPLLLSTRNLPCLPCSSTVTRLPKIGDTFIRLFDGGWQSNTTKSRLNAILSEHGDCGDKVFAKNFDWFVQMNTVQGLTVVLLGDASECSRLILTNSPNTSLTLMTISELGSATKLDLLVADTQGQIKYTVLKPSKRGVKALSGKRAWSNAVT